MSYGDSHQTAGERALLVGRPRGAAWRTLQADGIVWEGQVVLVGGDSGLATRMIVTHRRVVFARGGLIALDLTRDWLRPAPILRRDGTILLSITPPGSGYGIEPETFALRMRDGHPAAGHVIAMLAGSGARRISPEAVPSSEYVRGLLPPLPDGRRHAPTPMTATEPELPEFPRLPSRLDDDLSFDSLDHRPPPRQLPPLLDLPKPGLGRDTVVRPAAPPMSLTHDRTWNLEPMREIAPRGVRRRRRGWIFRLGGLVVLIGVASLFATDRVPLRTAPQPAQRDVAATATVRPVAQFVALTVAAGMPMTVVAESTAVALGVGGDTASSAFPTPAPAAVPARQATERAPANEAAAAAPAATVAAAGAAANEPPAAIESTSPQAATDEPAPAAAPADDGASQPAAAAPAVTPALRQTVDLAKRGATLPEFGLAAANDDDWITILLTVANESEAEVSLSLASYSLRSADTEFAPDKRSTVVASILGLDDAPDALESETSLDPGDSIELALVFQVPPDAAGLELVNGETTIELGPEVAASGQLTMSRGFAAETPKAIEATVLGDILGRDD